MKENMWKRLSEQLSSLSTGWVTLAGLIIFLLFTALVLPGQAENAKIVAGGAGTPDLSLYYTTTDLYRMAEVYGPQGRAAYIQARLTFDVIWPLVYTLALVTATSWLSRKISPAGSRLRLLNLSPLVGAGLDYLENFSTSLVMARYPAQTPLVDALAPIFTLLKWVTITGSFMILIALVAAALWQQVSHKTIEP